jgi:GNAT superfamily N-acetyltransferase
MMDIQVRALTPALLADYLAYFDNTAFSDNPEWAGCYCYFYLRAPEREDWETRTAGDNRASVSDLIDADLERTGSIVCFNIAPGKRRLGIATALLDAALQGLAAQGMSVVEAYPSEGAATDAGHYHGPLEMYLRAGFSVHRSLESCQVVRKQIRC